MDNTTTATTTAATVVKLSPEDHEAEPDRPRVLPAKPLSFTNGVLKIRHPLPLVPHAPPPPPHDGGGGAYRECLKNHAAAMGGHAVDGCGEFMPSPSSSLLCAACGCHRNFHRRDNTASATDNQISDYQPLHRHHPPPPAPPRSPNSASPPPISSTYYPSAPHMLLALSTNPNPNPNPSPNTNTARRRFRTRFSQAQKDKMFEFAEKLAWKMQRKDEDVINAFCNSIGVEKGVFKVWMHNNKNTLGKRDNPTVGGVNSTVVNNGINLDDSSTPDHHGNHHRQRNGDDEVSGNRVGTNGSSSSS